MRIPVLIICIIFLVGCKKVRTAFYGPVSLSGKVFDFSSGEAISNAVVELVIVEERFGHLDYRTGDIDTTDIMGNYAFSFDASGEYELKINAYRDRLYMRSAGRNGKKISITSSGTYEEDITCFRTAVAKINLTNTVPIDTCKSFEFTGYNNIFLFNIIADTTIYLLLSGEPNKENTIIYKRKTDPATTKIFVNVAPWDTIELNRNY